MYTSSVCSRAEWSETATILLNNGRLLRSAFKLLGLHYYRSRCIFIIAWLPILSMGAMMTPRFDTFCALGTSGQTASLSLLSTATGDDCQVSDVDGMGTSTPAPSVDRVVPGSVHPSPYRALIGSISRPWQNPPRRPSCHVRNTQDSK